jgi:ABC-type branched-subunit amino acid transport system substrate-binding protein
LVHKTGPVSFQACPVSLTTTVISIDRKTFGRIALIIVILAAGAWIGYTAIHVNTPVRVGVLLALTGDVDFTEPLEWAKDTINNGGGIGGRKVELVYKDTTTGTITQQAQEFLDDDSVRIVIGPTTSDEMYALAPAFIAKKKVLISPTATSGDIIRAFGKNGYYIWRTTQGDAAQVRVILTILKEKEVKKVALIVENSTYGQTFYDWTGFFATEYGIDVPFIRQVDAGSDQLDVDVTEALKADPDYIVAAVGPEDAATIKRAIDRSGSRTKLFLTDAAATPVLVSSLGAAAEGLEGTNPTADPNGGFTGAYERTFKKRPADFAATAYDALLIAAFTEARQERNPFETPGESVRQVVTGDGAVTGWNASGVRTAIDDILHGSMPRITGASSSLEYDEVLGVDPTATYYANWQVNNGTFLTVRVINSRDPAGTEMTGRQSAGLSRASAGYMSSSSALPKNFSTPAGRTGFQAVIVGPSRGWKNYRHEADALSVYTLLRENGVSDDNIILMLYDDIPTAPENPLWGNIHNIPKGPNIRSGAQVDYSGVNVTAAMFREIMTGTKTASTPVVLTSNASTDVLVFIASHGKPGWIVFGTGNSVLTAEEFGALTDSMGQERRYRQMAFFVDTCFGESVAANLTAPGILYLTGSDRNEPSLGAVYDLEIKQWLSDEFTTGVLSTISTDKNITFRDLYPATYARVTGSHVRMISTGNFDQDVPVMTYLRP